MHPFCCLLGISHHVLVHPDLHRGPDFAIVFADTRNVTLSWSTIEDPNTLRYALMQQNPTTQYPPMCKLVFQTSGRHFFR